jgi:hypothetical protein
MKPMAKNIHAAPLSEAELTAQAEELGKRVAAIPIVAATMEVYGNYDEAMEQAEFYLSQSEHRPLFASSSSAA